LPHVAERRRENFLSVAGSGEKKKREAPRYHNREERLARPCVEKEKERSTERPPKARKRKGGELRSREKKEEKEIRAKKGKGRRKVLTPGRLLEKEGEREREEKKLRGEETAPRFEKGRREATENWKKKKKRFRTTQT